MVRRSIFVGSIAATSILAAIVGCGLDLGGTGETDDAGAPPEDASLADHDNGGPLDAGGDEPADTAPPPRSPCSGDAGPLGVVVGDAGFCIDSTEVTNQQYLLFYQAVLADAGPAAPAACGPHDYRPVDWKTAPPYYPISDDTLPVSRPDWCDAYAYCKWAGKHLCGARDGGGVRFDDYRDAATSEWDFACSAGGTRAYPYGDTYDVTACNGNDLSHGLLLHAGALASCVGGFPGIFDMSGSVWEWEDACDNDAGAADRCRLRGGSCIKTNGDLACDADQSQRRDFNNQFIGIRCCSAP